MGKAHKVQVVSVYGYSHTLHHYHHTPPASHHPPPMSPLSRKNATNTVTNAITTSSTAMEEDQLQPPTSEPATCVWLSVLEPKGTYMDPIKLQGLLSLHSQQVSG